MRLQQGQIWKQGDAYMQVVHLERLEVQYKTFHDLRTREGTHHHVSKKEFCRLIKNAALLPAEEARKARTEPLPDGDETSAHQPS